MASLIAGGAVAQDDARVGVPVGEADLYPAVRVDYLSNDNVFVEDEDPVDGTSVVVSPSLELVAERRLLTVRAVYSGRFADGSEDVLDYTDHTLRVDGEAQLDKRHRLGAFAAYFRGHQEIGFDLTRGRAVGLDEPVTFDQLTAGGSYRFGVVDARGNLEAGFRVDARSYANLDTVTDGRDFTAVRPYGLFSYRLSGDTRALVELRYGAYSTDNDVDDRGELSLFGGAEFAATGRLRGEARVGVTRADYERESREDVTLLAASADLSYLVRDYATLRLTAERELDDSAIQLGGGTEAQAITDTFRLTWLHDWSSRLSHVAFAERSSVAQACPSGDSSTFTASAELNVAVRRWLSFGAGARVESRGDEACPGDEADDSLDYDRRVLGVHVRATL